eukprot:1341723-Alexandrium_andersonii.AAC.1
MLLVACALALGFGFAGQRMDHFEQHSYFKDGEMKKGNLFGDLVGGKHIRDQGFGGVFDERGTE